MGEPLAPGLSWAPVNVVPAQVAGGSGETSVSTSPSQCRTVPSVPKNQQLSQERQEPEVIPPWIGSCPVTGLPSRSTVPSGIGRGSQRKLLPSKRQRGAQPFWPVPMSQ